MTAQKVKNSEMLPNIAFYCVSVCWAGFLCFEWRLLTEEPPGKKIALQESFCFDFSYGVPLRNA